MAAQPRFLQIARAKAQPESVQSLNSDLHAVVTALRAASGHRPLTYEEIQAASKVDLTGYAVLEERLRSNPKVLVHAGGLLAYNPVHKLANKQDLLKLIEATPEGLDVAEVADSYATVQEDIDLLVESAAVIAVRSTDTRALVLFPRRGAVMCLMSGKVSVEKGSYEVHTTVDLRPEIERGDAISINGVVCRVSSNTVDKKDGVQVDNKDTLILNTGAGLSASSTRRHQTAKKYRREFTAKVLPLLNPFRGESVKGVQPEKFGFTNDVRKLWSGMTTDSSWPRDTVALMDQMRRAGIGGHETKTKFKASSSRRARKRARKRAPAALSSTMSYLANTAVGAQMLKTMQQQR